MELKVANSDTKIRAQLDQIDDLTEQLSKANGHANDMQLQAE